MRHINWAVLGDVVLYTVATMIGILIVLAPCLTLIAVTWIIFGR